MTDLVARNAFSDNQTTDDAQDIMDRWELMLDNINEAYGTGAEQTVTLAAGTFVETPTQPCLRISGGGTLSSIPLFLPDGHMLDVRITSTGQNVTLDHTGAGTGGLSCHANVDSFITHVSQMFTFQRRGTLWVEVARRGWSDLVDPGSLSNGWQDVPSRTAFSYRLSGEFVEVLGIIQNTGNLGAGVGTVVHQLPVGYRPGQKRQWVTWCEDNASQLMGVYVDGSGNVGVVPIGGTGYTALDIVILSLVFGHGG